MDPSDADAVIGAAEQAVVADAAAEEAKAGRGEAGGTCKNCGASLVGSHCHVCGQVNDQLHRPIWSLVADAMEGFFSLDGRFLKTVPALMFKPGRVSANYLAGARARFVQPFRLLLFASVVFLIAVSTVTGDWWTAVEFDSDDIDASLEEISEELTALADELEQNENASPQEVAALRAEIAAMQAAETVGESAGLTQMRELRRLQQQRAIKCALRREILPEDLGDCPETPMASEPDITISGVDGAVDPEDLTWPVGVRRFIVERAEVIVDDPAGYFEAVNTWVSTVLIALFPVYAAILGLTHFWKRRFFYYDHLIVSLHFHAFLFILITALIAIWPIVSWAVAVPVFFVWSNLYLYKVHRLVYGCGRFSSVLRTLVMDFLYLIVLSFVPAALLLGGFLTA